MVQYGVKRLTKWVFFSGQRKQFLQIEVFRSKWTKNVAASNPCALIKNKYEFRIFLEINWLLEMHFSTLDACCTLYCWRMVRPLFYQLHEVETVDLRVWIPFMTCLVWWASTTGPPRIPPSQGCEHLSAMSLISKRKKSKSATFPKVKYQKCNVPKKITKYFEEVKQIL